MDLRQTPEYAKYMESIGWIVERKGGVNYFIKKFSLIGSFIKIQRPEVLRDQEIKLIKRLSKKYRAFQIVIEPRKASLRGKPNLLIEHGFRLSRSPFVPAKTIHIDLTKSEKQLLKEMHYKTRYNIKKAISNKLKVTSSKNINQFADFWQKCALKQRGMFLSQKKEIIELYKAFGRNAHLLLGYKDKELISGILMIRTSDIAYYMYAASSDKGKKLFAPTLNSWETIKLAKKLGCKIFDFEGIYDERFPLKSWKGFTRFKKSFGGREIEYPGAFVKYRFPF
ncbi:hypothetical protein A2865_03800 [Candidatus Woesebacteria bacterium RIFCSPHIGHO2_01_FULL_39_17]|uniref:Methicillin resistance protein n=2 Tax=Candidatus Woeseibacteriota TaxID=1752722 RepID=A0A0G0NMV3_9BACT|nr:MAG: hypothetical protein US72_C0001G0043 [Microgenomates group bacterium GW2011_GWC1_38_12]KKR14106.1 MAG: Methicillin resistance protein [Candidatus Woesebacteria bacterium GW2011_GWA1_39_21b]OGM23551.1 MAG: hypothetical protein A2865_03800 [Candidatus Woesebacteria bacterium RIFCSPHIGHO2_01_FULL_39_17]OGM62996.1 MAG: hypothetical protein A3A52_03325 [Candidatus Woesebacteria bacterium RIFCSPLOWO2_01_FULL_39_14]